MSVLPGWFRIRHQERLDEALRRNSDGNDRWEQGGAGEWRLVDEEEASDAEPLLHSQGCRASACQADVCKEVPQTTTTEERRAWRLKKHLLLLVVMSTIWVVAATLLFYSMGFGPVDIVYLMVQIITTIGWGDVVPETQAHRLGCSFVVLGATLVVTNFIMVTIDMVLEVHTGFIAHSMALKEEQIRRDKEQKARMLGGASEQVRSHALAEWGRSERQWQHVSQARELGFNFVCWLACVLAGVVFFGVYDSCACTEHGEPIEGCLPHRCSETGGATRTWVDAFYMTVITMTTVGFGDLCAGSGAVRVVAAAWMLLSVVASVNFMGGFYEQILNFEAKGATDAKVRRLFHDFDVDGDGQLSRLEFLKMQLVQNGLVTEEQFESMSRQFDIIAGHDHQIDMTEYVAYYLPHHPLNRSNLRPQPKKKIDRDAFRSERPRPPTGGSSAEVAQISQGVAAAAAAVPATSAQRVQRPPRRQSTF